VISLYALELPGRGTSTRFATAALAARTLPAPLRRRSEGLRARQLFDLVSQRQDVRYRLEDFPQASGAEHPLLRAHGETGEPVLFVGQMHTDRILDLPEAESESLLRELLAHLYRPEHCYEHFWRPGDLLVWDNQALQHGRPSFDASEPRTLRRVVAGALVVKAYEHVA
jgi:taurine dioxygenase